MRNIDNTVVELASFAAKREKDIAPPEPDDPLPQEGGKARRFLTPLSLRMRAWEDGTQLFPTVIGFGAVIFALTVHRAPFAAMPAAAALGALLVLTNRFKLSLIAAVFGLNLLLNESARHSLECWILLGLAILAIVIPRRLLPTILQPPRWTWVLTLALVIACRATGFLLAGSGGALISIIGIPCAAYLGCGVARNLAMGDARLLTWGDAGLVPVARDLLLGRITSGMLHDLAQPLNVISMANGNLGYIVEQLDIDPARKADLADRVARIATHTETAAYILGLFRGFGRDGNRELTTLNVRSALERAVAATKSNVRHHGVSIDLAGDGLEHLIPTQHGALEMMTVAALLNAFASFTAPDGAKRKGKVRLMARLSPAFVVISVQCFGEDGERVPGPMLDHATHWLVEHVALAASGDFRCQYWGNTGTRFLIRLGRDDI
ncbi:hypothetical protein EDF56_11056 [Novosphingobium sp. PhB165]|uniref:hypothetical protein n=1 Tax=Novosphingobium sp. PhB165 TaxID=2485105 RepID=UPI001048270B|nr:hypothetical protein [Novosphingobium sp. PhB165]TCM15376.1 hypothetical protein EDF56_11056 [Novosphingobium sp. PhB165]